MRILAIETSCDETAVSVLEATGDSTSAAFRVVGDALFSQAALHEAYGGVYPNLAKREHQKNLAPLTARALQEAGLLKRHPEPVQLDAVHFSNIRDEGFQTDTKEFVYGHEKPAIDLIAVTNGPGLEPALWTGITFAEALGKAWGIPVIGVDHMEGHIFSALVRHEGEHWQLQPLRFPILALLISGGHTELVVMKSLFEYELVGKTKDDAIGEAFDKVARLLDLPYPGGPEIGKHASRARERAAEHGIVFPRPLAHDNTCDFSFSGLKTAVLYKLRDMPKLSDQDKEHIAEAFEDAAGEIVIIKTRRALEKTNPNILAVGGGVSANLEIREGLQELIQNEFPNVSLALPDKRLTGDNAIMIGIAAYLRHQSGAGEAGLTANGSQSLA